MQKWQFPNPDRDGFPFKHIEEIKEWFTGRDAEYPNYKHPYDSDFSKGWSKPWPYLLNRH